MGNIVFLQFFCYIGIIANFIKFVKNSNDVEGDRARNGAGVGEPGGDPCIVVTPCEQTE